MNVLVTGGSSLLGRYLYDTIPDGIQAAFTWCNTLQPWCAHQLDVCDMGNLVHVFSKTQPGAVIHMGSWGSVDECDRNFKLSWQVNVEGTRNLLKVAADYEATVLFTSTNAVFDGNNGPYGEDDEREPVNRYGSQRRAAENAVMRYNYGWMITRLFLLYGWEPAGARGNWASNAVRTLKAGQRLTVTEDHWYMPTYAHDAARAVWGLLDQGQRGADVSRQVYHVAGDDRVTLHQFVLSVADQWSLDRSLVEPAPYAQVQRRFGLTAPRPVDTSYKLDKAHGLGIRCRGVREGLAAMYQEWLEGANGGPN